MECAAKARGTRCTGGPPTRRCGRCGAVAYCSISHQVSHWSDHKEECARLEQQMLNSHILHDFPFTFSNESTFQVCEREVTRCSFLMKRDIHHVGMWKFECSCWTSNTSFDYSRDSDGWGLPSDLCPCRDPVNPISTQLSNWKDYYEWRCLPLHSPAALLLHWPLTIFHAVKLAGISNSTFKVTNKLHIHYLGPDIELRELAIFGELHALFPGLQVHIDFFGPEVPQLRDGSKINLHAYAHCVDIECDCKSLTEAEWRISDGTTSVVSLQLHKGFYHDLYRNLKKDPAPDLIIAPNAGIAAYPSWLPTIELIKEMNVPAIFSDYCEEAAYLAASCIGTVTKCPVTVPIQINPFRQPMAVEDSVLYLACYSNCFLFGM
ncbi:hypothetical protein MKX01_024238 [Papaver californicum]|nr:hypothetical protein MKX01_024238 [Papaver californicum]